MHRVKKLVKRIPGFRILSDIYWLQRSILKIMGYRQFLGYNIKLSSAAVRFYLSRKSYRIISEQELYKTRTSDKIFVFGSGYSLNQITPEQWQYIEKHDTIGFSGFIYQKWIRVKYHLVREWVSIPHAVRYWKTWSTQYTDPLNKNPLFKDTILIIQGEYKALFTNRLLGYGFIDKGKTVFRFKTVRNLGLPSLSISKGLRHGRATLCDAVNFSFCMGYKEIVLVGVDLYDNRYFWCDPDKTYTYDEDLGCFVQKAVNTRGMRYNERHNTVNNGIIEEMGEWNDFFLERGVRMSVYNPKSLLTQVLPVYELVKQS